MAGVPGDPLDVVGHSRIERQPQRARRAVGERVGERCTVPVSSRPRRAARTPFHELHLRGGRRLRGRRARVGNDGSATQSNAGASSAAAPRSPRGREERRRWRGGARRGSCRSHAKSGTDRAASATRHRMRYGPHRMESIDWRAEGDRCVALLQDLLRIPTVNRGTNAPGDGNERPAAERVAAFLREAGVEPRFFEKTPGRTNLVVRLRRRPAQGGAATIARPAPPQRAPRRRRGGRVAVEAPAVRRRDPRRLAMGPRRDRHEAHGGDERVRRRDARAREAGPSPRSHLRRRRRRRGRVHPGEPVSHERAPR